MFHLHIPRLRHALQHHLTVRYQTSLVSQGRLLPEIEEALNGLGNDFSLDVKIPGQVTMAALKDLPVKVDIASNDETPRESPYQLVLSGKMQGDALHDGLRTFHPDSVELGLSGEETVPRAVFNFLTHLKNPGHAIGSLRAQV